VSLENGEHKYFTENNFTRDISKTFLISLILVIIRSQNDTALAIASSGIAALFWKVVEHCIQY
jgi:hypothetical protein